MDLVGLVGLGIALFGLSNLDDLLLLAAWFADPRKRKLAVVVGQGWGRDTTASVWVGLGAFAAIPTHTTW